MDEERDIRRVGIAISDEGLGFRFENSCLKEPTALARIGNVFH
jgi:hypothetical protein